MCENPVERCRVIGRRLNRSQGLRPIRSPGVTVSVRQCDRCGLVFPDPLPIPFDVSQHYDVDPKEYWSEGYFAFGRDYFREQIDTFRTLRPNPSSPVALDIGAGLGKAMRALASAGFVVQGIEPSRQFCRAAIELGGIEPKDLVETSIESASFSPESFDLVTFGAVLEHLQDPAGALYAATEWLKPNGLIHLEVPSADWLIARVANRLYRLQRSDYVANLSPMHPPYHLYEFRLEAFSQHGIRAGYRVAHHRRYVGDTYLPRALAPFAQFYMERTSSGMQLEVWLEKAA